MEELNRTIELTNLKPDLKDADLESLIRKAIDFNFLGVCVPPFWVKKARRDIGDSGLLLVTVAGFPLGYQKTEEKLAGIENAIEDGADEIDLVWNNSAFKSGMNWSKIEVAKASGLCHENGKILKVIIETCLLNDSEIMEVSGICADAGADFVKTSTGMLGEGAKVEHIQLIRNSIPEIVGIKASGGINDAEFAKDLIRAGATRIGSSSADRWINS